MKSVNKNYEFETLVKDLFNANPNVVKFLTKEFYKAQAEEGPFEYQDNFRVCEIGNVVQEQTYKAARAHGCCGFYDSEPLTYKGKTYMFGFNYGH